MADPMSANITSLPENKLEVKKRWSKLISEAYLEISCISQQEEYLTSRLQQTHFQDSYISLSYFEFGHAVETIIGVAVLDSMKSTSHYAFSLGLGVTF